MCFGIISKYLTTNNMKKRGSNGHVYNSSVNYNIIDNSGIINIHKYMMKRHDVKQCLDLLKECLLDY